MTRRDLSLTCFVVAAVTALVLSGCQAGSTSPTDPASGELTAVSGSKGKPPGTGGGGGGGGGDDGGDNEATTFDYTHAGDVTTDPLTGLGTSGAGGTMVMDGCCDAVQEDLVLSDALLDLVDGTGTCFPRGASFTVAFAGHIEADKKTGGVLARYFFDAFDQSGSALGYEMVLLGGVSGPFPPGVGETVTIDWTSGSIGSQGKGKGKNNGCIGDLTTAVAGDTVVVTGTS